MLQVCCCLSPAGTCGQVMCGTCEAALCYQQGGQIIQDSKLSLLWLYYWCRYQEWHLKEKIHIPEAEHKIFIWRGRGLINFSYKCLQLKVVINNLPKAIFQFALTGLYYTLYFQETIIIITGHGISLCLMNVFNCDRCNIRAQFKLGNVVYSGETWNCISMYTSN